MERIAETPRRKHQHWRRNISWFYFISFFFSSWKEKGGIIMIIFKRERIPVETGTQTPATGIDWIEAGGGHRCPPPRLLRLRLRLRHGNWDNVSRDDGCRPLLDWIDIPDWLFPTFEVAGSHRLTRHLSSRLPPRLITASVNRVNSVSDTKRASHQLH